MQQGFGVAVEGAGLRGVVALRLIIKRQEEGGRLNGIQGHFVHALAEKFQPSLSPRNSARGRFPERGQCLGLPVRTGRAGVTCVSSLRSTSFLRSGQRV